MIKMLDVYEIIRDELKRGYYSKCVTQGLDKDSCWK